MEASVRQVYTAAILEEAASRFGTQPEALRPLGDFESFVYAFDADLAAAGPEPDAALGGARILRVTHSSHRGPRAIAGELDWIVFLAERGLGVARGLHSLDGLLVEPIAAEDGSTFTAACFVRVPGTPAGQSPWGPLLFRSWGRLIGELHLATADYPLGDAEHPERLRHRWDESPYLAQADALLPAGAIAARARLAELRAELAALPTARRHFGLIHEDLHASNFNVDGDGRLWAYDFDDCSYHWLPDDLAVALYYALWHPTAREDPTGFAQGFTHHLLAGYQEVAAFDPAWLDWFPLFLRLRDLTLYIVCHAKWDFDALTEGQAALMRAIGGRIEAGEPAVRLDYAALRAGLEPGPG